MPSIDLAFRINGASIPVDHGYALYAALSRITPELHAAREIGVQPIRGVYSGNGALHLTDSSRLILRMPDGQIRNYLKLAGKKLDIGEQALRVGDLLFILAGTARPTVSIGVQAHPTTLIISPSPSPSPLKGEGIKKYVL